MKEFVRLLTGGTGKADDLDALDWKTDPNALAFLEMCAKQSLENCQKKLVEEWEHRFVGKKASVYKWCSDGQVTHKCFFKLRKKYIAASKLSKVNGKWAIEGVPPRKRNAWSWAIALARTEMGVTGKVDVKKGSALHKLAREITPLCRDAIERIIAEEIGEEDEDEEEGDEMDPIDVVG